MSDFGFYEFFCGGGMARAGLGERWRCLFANDFDAAKGRAYAENWGARALKIADVANLGPRDLPGRADLAWASFPCQDLSLAGPGGGLGANRSGAFWPFWRLMQALGKEGRAPKVIALENVRGALTSRRGEDFRSLVEALAREGYAVGAMVIDGVDFTPQSRPRLFFVAVCRDLVVPAALIVDGPGKAHPRALTDTLTNVSPQARDAWRWWRLPLPARRNLDLIDLLEDSPVGAPWRTQAQTRRLVDLMSPLQREKLAAAQRSGRRAVGAVYRRTRRDTEGGRLQRAEVRFDGLAGCLRTPAGGSSRQSLLIVEGDEVRSRLVSPREAARLMGLAESYRLPQSATDAYHLLGDGVVAPVVRHLSEHLIEPILFAQRGVERRRA